MSTDTTDQGEAYFVYRNTQRRVFFRWDGQAPTATVHDLDRLEREEVPLQGGVYEPEQAIGWLAWFQQQCMSHIRMREAAGEHVVQPKETHDD
jgi:hypothetical protein